MRAFLRPVCAMKLPPLRENLRTEFARKIPAQNLRTELAHKILVQNWRTEYAHTILAQNSARRRYLDAQAK